MFSRKVKSTRRLCLGHRRKLLKFEFQIKPITKKSWHMISNLKYIKILTINYDPFYEGKMLKVIKCYKNKK